MVRHALLCTGGHSSEKLRVICATMKTMVMHTQMCEAPDCGFAWCGLLRALLAHDKDCLTGSAYHLCKPPELPQRLAELHALNAERREAEPFVASNAPWSCVDSCVPCGAGDAALRQHDLPGVMDYSFQLMDDVGGAGVGLEF
mmetsp:Transcript_5965/g.16694  ORF Transcript_5965/g.16694 Transcript_5965/m.16694 type:complete len:143 (-) Transcript_5965:292-720(-)